MSKVGKKHATYADLEAVPPHLVAEIIEGELVTHPRPSPRHGVAAYALGAKLGEPYQFGGSGPGGWIFVVEPELHLGKHVVVPDIAGWRRDRMPSLPDSAYIEIAPDWVCEVLSASTERRDRTAKSRIYAMQSVGHLWFLDPRVQALEVLELNNGGWLPVGFWRSDDLVSAPPFDAISFSLADLWPLDRPLGLNEDPQHLFVGDR